MKRLFAKLTLAAVGFAAAVWWLGGDGNAPPSRQAAQPPAVATPAEPALPTTPAPPPTPEAPASAIMALPSCPHQHIDLEGDGHAERGCLSATRGQRNGSVRSYVMEPDGLSRWRLVVDMAGGHVNAMRLSRPAQGPQPAVLYGCHNAGCAGVQVGPADAWGVRALKLDSVALQALAAQGRWQRELPDEAAGHTVARAGAMTGERTDAQAGTVRVQAALALPADRQACPVPSATLVRPDGGKEEFCPLGSAGFELAEDGAVRYLFRDLEGRSLEIAMAPDGQVDRLSLGASTCLALKCSGTSVQVRGAADSPASERTFTFSGVALHDPRSGPGITQLTGSLTMPSQE